MKEEEKKRIISIGVTYENYMRIQPPVDELIRLEAFLIASALFSWTSSSRTFSWLIDHIRVIFNSGSVRDDIIVIFKLTFKPLSRASACSTKIMWHKNRNTLESPLGENTVHFDTIENCLSKDQVIAGIKKILYDFLLWMSRNTIEEGQYLARLSANIKENM